MKTRNCFVSNSSSSSFLLILNGSQELVENNISKFDVVGNKQDICNYCKLNFSCDIDYYTNILKLVDSLDNSINVGVVTVSRDSENLIDMLYQFEYDNQIKILKRYEN